MLGWIIRSRRGRAFERRTFLERGGEKLYDTELTARWTGVMNWGGSGLEGEMTVMAGGDETWDFFGEVFSTEGADFPSADYPGVKTYIHLSTLGAEYDDIRLSLFTLYICAQYLVKRCRSPFMAS
jgi:hypothetical protein